MCLLLCARERVVGRAAFRALGGRQRERLSKRANAVPSPTPHPPDPLSLLGRGGRGGEGVIEGEGRPCHFSFPPFSRTAASASAAAALTFSLASFAAASSAGS